MPRTEPTATGIRRRLLAVALGVVTLACVVGIAWRGPQPAPDARAIAVASRDSTPARADIAPTPKPKPTGGPQIAEILPEDLAPFPELNLALHSPTWHAPRRAHERRLRLISALYEDLGREPELAVKAQEIVEMFERHETEKWTLQDVVDTADEAQFENHFRALLARHDRELEELIGAAGITALRRYERTLEARYEVEELRDWLGGTDLALSAAQRRAMLDAILRPGVFIHRRQFSVGESPEAIRQEVEARLEQNDRQLLDSARLILNGVQWNLYAEELAARRADAIAAEIPEFAETPAATTANSGQGQR
jgi:hypothetical protein